HLPALFRERGAGDVEDAAARLGGAGRGGTAESPLGLRGHETSVTAHRSVTSGWLPIELHSRVDLGERPRRRRIAVATDADHLSIGTGGQHDGAPPQRQVVADDEQHGDDRPGDHHVLDLDRPEGELTRTDADVLDDAVRGEMGTELAPSYGVDELVGVRARRGVVRRHEAVTAVGGGRTALPIEEADLLS